LGVKERFENLATIVRFWSGGFRKDLNQNKTGMDDSLNKSSCEIISEIRNLEVSSEKENQGNSQNEENPLESPGKDSEDKSSSESSSSDTSKSSQNSSSSADTDEPKKKRSRKRKRHRKKKTTTAYEPPRPFLARYKKVKLMETTVQPKLHIRFDDDTGEPDKMKSEYNFKPRIIKALEKNLTILENYNKLLEVTAIASPPIASEIPLISLKPRIIKAILIT
jgi:hypothetical protein